MKWLIMLCAIGMIVGCSVQRQAPSPVEQQKIRLGAVPEHVSWLREQLVARYEASQQAVVVDVVSTPFAPDADPQKRAMQWSAWFESADRPDVAMVDADAYSGLIDRNALRPLAPLIKAERFGLDDIAPSVVAALRGGDGQLYGLAPFYGASALFYRTDVLQQAGTGVPDERMTWSDVFAIAQDVQQSAKHGIAFSAWSQTNIIANALVYGAPLGVRMVDPLTWRMDVDTDAWERVVTELLSMVRAGTLATIVQPASGRKARSAKPINWFISGDVPLVISDHTFVNDLIRENEHREKNNVQSIMWGIAPIPVHADVPKVGGSVRIPDVFVLPAQSTETSAWDLMEYVHSAQYAQLRGAEVTWLPSHMRALRPQAGLDYDVRAFAIRTPSVLGDASQLYAQYPQLVALEHFGYRHIARALRGEQTVRQALRRWAREGNALLLEARTNKK